MKHMFLCPTPRFSHPHPSDNCFSHVNSSRGGGAYSFNSGSINNLCKDTSMVEGLSVLFEMGHAMGFNMTGCEKDKFDVIS